MMQKTQMIQDIEEYGAQHTKNPIAKFIIRDILAEEASIKNADDFQRVLGKICRKYKTIFPKAALGKVYKTMVMEDPTIIVNSKLSIYFMKKAGRSRSGILNVSVVMRPEKFSCKYNCYFCPNETIANGAKVDMPRSYLSNEDAVRRAADVEFDAIRQVHVRLAALENNGHPLDKIELRVLGGTFSCYPKDYAYEFIRDLYYAVNTFKADPRQPLTLAEEQHLNQTHNIHVVGLGLETRPDEIDAQEIKRFRDYGCTRVELGVQHTEDFLLKKLNRGHGVKHSIQAIRLLKNAGFKVEIHIMADLPGTTPELDKLCYSKVLLGEDLIPDYLKDYPCLAVSFTEVKKWLENGKWKPYSERDIGLLEDVLVHRQKITRKMVRVNRTQRDFPNAKESNDYLGYTSQSIPSDLGDKIHKKAIKMGIYCQCIRCREIKDESFDPRQIKYYTLGFTASGCKEYFISAEIPRPNSNLLLGFIRLRILSKDKLHLSSIAELQSCDAMIRELHVYGRVTSVGEKGNGAQHAGIGKKLLAKAEWIAKTHFRTKMAIISGIGVREYYARRGYSLDGTYMVKKLFTLREFMTLIFVASILLYLCKFHSQLCSWNLGNFVGIH